MTTVINNPGGSDNSGGMLSTVIGIIVLIVAVTLFIIYALPAIQNSGSKQAPKATEIKVTLPAPQNESPKP
jgi:hypothetical protein